MSKQTKIALVVAGVLLCAGVVGVIYFTSTKKDVDTDVVVNKDAAKKTQPTIEPLVVGQISDDFPETLAPVGAVVISSQNATYQGTTMHTGNFSSGKTLSAEYNSYLTYFSNNKYEVTAKELTKNSAHIYAVSPTSIVNIVMNQPQPKGSVTITVNYLPTVTR